MRKLLLCALLAVGLSACDDDDKKASNDIADVVTRQIEKKTCDEQAPEDLNARELSDAEKSIDIDKLDVDCAG